MRGRKIAIRPQTLFPGIECPSCRNRVAEFLVTQGLRGFRALPGHEEAAFRQEVGQQEGPGAIPIPVLVFRTLTGGATLIAKSSVVTSVQVEEPALLLEIAGRRLRTCAHRSGSTPEIAEVVSGVTSLTLTVGGHRHSREKPRPGGVILRVKEHGRDRVLPVVVMRIPIRAVIAIRNRALADVETKEGVPPFHRFVHHRIIDSALHTEDQRELTNEADLVERAVAAQPTVHSVVVPLWPRHGMPPGPHTTLPLCDLHGELPDGGQHFLVPGGEKVFGEQ